jgi:hypothetical protein
MSLSMEKADLPLLRYALQNLGYGTLRWVPTDHVYNLTVGGVGLEYLLAKVGGHIHDSVRRPQLLQQMRHYPLAVSEAQLRRGPHSAWFAGFFDADGTVVLTQEANEQIAVTISITNNKAGNLKLLQKRFGGSLRAITPKTAQVHYRWTIRGRAAVLAFAAYAQTTPCRSTKAQRLGMVAKLYSMKDLNLHRTDHPRYGEWVKFREQWNAVNQKEIQRKPMLPPTSGKVPKLGSGMGDKFFYRFSPLWKEGGGKERDEGWGNTPAAATAAEGAASTPHPPPPGRGGGRVEAGPGA